MKRIHSLLPSITGYSRFLDQTRIDGDGQAPVLFAGTVGERTHQLTQEGRLVSKNLDPFQLVLGGYYLQERLYTPVSFDAAFISPLLTGPFAALAPYAPFGTQDNATQQSHLYALYGSLKWNVAPGSPSQWGRGKPGCTRPLCSINMLGPGTPNGFGTITPLPANLLPLGAVFAKATGLGLVMTRQAARTDQHFSPSVIVAYKPAETLNFYAKYVNGFKSRRLQRQRNAGRSLAFEPE